ncbi:MAG: sulfatase-like hydrolase/transferase [candidate division KSB1 bacterium]|nr:sulfatase-like hydrolase/transferase [candidate division KSB1 bacterium]
MQGLERDKEILRMQIYAAMIDRVDQNIGRLLDKLEQQGELDNTLILFASDNGACAEGAPTRVRSEDIQDFGAVASYETVGEDWATVQNTPLRYWKNWSHEGGICTPLIAQWTGYIVNTGGFYRQPIHFIDFMSTFVEIAGASYPQTYNAEKITPMQGAAIVPSFRGESIRRGKPLFWEWRKGGGMRVDDTKAVFYEKEWDLYDIESDRTETRNLAEEEPEMLNSMQAKWRRWYKSVKDSVDLMP